MSTCKHGNTASDHLLDALHENQGGAQRHKCTECAYERGYQAGRQQATSPTGNEECSETHRRVSVEMIEALPESQAGPGRHKCCVCAYHAGFEAGRALPAR